MQLKHDVRHEEATQQDLTETNRKHRTGVRTRGLTGSYTPKTGSDKDAFKIKQGNRISYKT